MGRYLGIDFAPLNVPFERRFQTISVLGGMLLFFLGGITGSVLFVYLFFTRYYYVSLLYGAYLWYDRDTPHRGGRKWNWFTSLIFFKKAIQYYPAHLIKTADLSPDKNYILGSHPHGVNCAGVSVSLGSDYNGFSKLYPGCKVRGLTLTLHFMCPFVRELLLSCNMCSSSPRSIEYIFTKLGTGNMTVIVPGGSAEAMESHPNTAVLILKNRKGFVRMAIKHGVSLVPVYSFGETDLYDQIPNPEGSLIRKIQTKFKDTFGIPLYLLNGRGIFQYSFGILPRRRPIYTVVGSAIDVEKDENPSQELVDRYHALYVEKLTQLFEEYKTKVGNGAYKDQVLVIK